MEVKPSATPPPGAEPEPATGSEPDLITVLEALSDPMRLEIVRRLAEGEERACGCIGLPVGKSTITHHLQALRAAGVIVQREEGTRRMSRLDREGMERRFPGLLRSVLAAADQGAEPRARG